ncbi:unnamed protein product [marine sediment metagenome]|uniref:Uncharacterized protein n=1 Tax=marine sediment metagenome TaxID=412755 RepID=X1PR04_9ZZZZ
MRIKNKRKAGEILGRAALAARIQELAREAAGGSYKDAMAVAGKISVLAEAATYDDYWGEKVGMGRMSEEFNLQVIAKNGGEK